jgi:hypothetical protein
MTAGRDDKEEGSGHYKEALMTGTGGIYQDIKYLSLENIITIYKLCFRCF